MGDLWTKIGASTAIAAVSVQARWARTRPSAESMTAAKRRLKADQLAAMTRTVFFGTAGFGVVLIGVKPIASVMGGPVATLCAAAALIAFVCATCWALMGSDLSTTAVAVMIAAMAFAVPLSEQIGKLPGADTVAAGEQVVAGGASSSDRIRPDALSSDDALPDASKSLLALIPSSQVEGCETGTPSGGAWATIRCGSSSEAATYASFATAREMNTYLRSASSGMRSRGTWLWRSTPFAPSGRYYDSVGDTRSVVWSDHDRLVVVVAMTPRTRGPLSTIAEWSPQP